MDRFAVCLTATKGAQVCFSCVSSILLEGDFVSLFEKHKKADNLVLVEVKISAGPQGPWQSVDAKEPLTVLRDLQLRHISFKLRDEVEEELYEGDEQLLNILMPGVYALICFHL